MGMNIYVVLHSNLSYPLQVGRALMETCVDHQITFVSYAALSSLSVEKTNVCLILRRDLVIDDPAFLYWVRSGTTYLPTHNDPKNPDLMVYRGHRGKSTTPLSIPYRCFGPPRRLIGIAGTSSLIRYLSRRLGTDWVETDHLTRTQKWQTLFERRFLLCCGETQTMMAHIFHQDNEADLVDMRIIIESEIQRDTIDGEIRLYFHSDLHSCTVCLRRPWMRRVIVPMLLEWNTSFSYNQHDDLIVHLRSDTTDAVLDRLMIILRTLIDS